MGSQLYRSSPAASLPPLVSNCACGELNLIRRGDVPWVLFQVAHGCKLSCTGFQYRFLECHSPYANGSHHPQMGFLSLPRCSRLQAIKTCHGSFLGI